MVKNRVRKANCFLSQLGSHDGRNSGALVGGEDRLKRARCRRFNRNGLRTMVSMKRMGFLFIADPQELALIGGVLDATHLYLKGTKRERITKKRKSEESIEKDVVGPVLLDSMKM